MKVRKRFAHQDEGEKEFCVHWAKMPKVSIGLFSFFRLVPQFKSLLDRLVGRDLHAAPLDSAVGGHRGPGQRQRPRKNQQRGKKDYESSFKREKIKITLRLILPRRNISERYTHIFCKVMFFDLNLESFCSFFVGSA
jgi:hypothetical protein